MFESIATKEMDEFVDIIGYEGYYQINRLGDIRNIKKGIGRLVGKILTPIKNRDGYYTITLSIKGKKIHHSIHRLLGIQFIPNPENKPTIDHIDRNSQNNSLENLRWATYKEQNANTSICCFVRGVSKKDLQKQQLSKYGKKYYAWKTISHKFLKILLE